MNIQLKYWKMLVQLKAATFYLNIYADRSYKWERRINIITAIASSASIGGWVIWQQISFVWSFVIALSQVVNAIMPFFPFKKRLEIVKNMAKEIQDLFIIADYDWFKVANGDFTENEINDLILNLRKKYNDIQDKYMSDGCLLENEKIKNLADKKTDMYFEYNN